VNFEFTSEQAMLKDSVDKLVEQRFTLDARKSLLNSELGFSRDNWRQLADLGVLGLSFPESEGGFGGGPIETMIVMEAFGRALALEPYLATVVLAGAAIRHGVDDARRADLVSAIAGGERVVAFAHDEERARYHLSLVETRAEKRAGGFKLSGRKIGVLQGGIADAFVVSARTRGEAADPSGLTLFLVPAGAAGVRVTAYANFDGTRAAIVELNGVDAGADAVLGAPDEGLGVIERAVDEGIAAISAEAVGVMGKALWTTVDYLKTRRQFGGPIGRFQALQHRAAEMYVALEQARSMAIYAAMHARESDPRERRRAISQAKIQIAKSARFVGQQAVQLHGGIGMTEEYVVGHLFRRLTMIERQFGDVDHHLGLLEDLEASDTELADVR
jgi:pimeloyl-CoA dehydrogenase small subunit